MDDDIAVTFSRETKNSDRLFFAYKAEKLTLIC